MTVKQLRKLLVGRRIVSYRAHAFRAGKGRPITFDPELTFDDGSRLTFTVNETDVGEYGITPHLWAARKEGK